MWVIIADNFWSIEFVQKKKRDNESGRWGENEREGGEKERDKMIDREKEREKKREGERERGRARDR